MPKSFMSRFKTYRYNTCADLTRVDKTGKTVDLSVREILTLNPSHVSWNIKTNGTCSKLQAHVLDSLLELKGKRKLMTDEAYNAEVKEEIESVIEGLNFQSKEHFINTARTLRKEISSRRSGAKGQHRRRRRNTKKKRKLVK